MATVSDVFDAVQAVIDANPPSGVALHWQNEDDGALPDTPSAFAYVELMPEPAKLVGFGGGRGANLYRAPIVIAIFVFVPNGEGFKAATDKAEAFAGLFRGYRDATISCHAASVMASGAGESLAPPGLRSEVGNYWCAVAQVEATFDQTG